MWHFCIDELLYKAKSILKSQKYFLAWILETCIQFVTCVFFYGDVPTGAIHIVQVNSLALLRPQAWWRHQMETFSASLALCAVNSPVPVNSPHKGQWRGALMFSLIYVWINDWVNNRDAGEFRRHRGHYDVIVMNDLSLDFYRDYSRLSHFVTRESNLIQSYRSYHW